LGKPEQAPQKKHQLKYPFTALMISAHSI